MDYEEELERIKQEFRKEIKNLSMKEQNAFAKQMLEIERTERSSKILERADLGGHEERYRLAKAFAKLSMAPQFRSPTRKELTKKQAELMKIWQETQPIKKPSRRQRFREWIKRKKNALKKIPSALRRQMKPK